MEGGINKKQKKLLSVIDKYINGAGYPPTFAEIKKTLGVSSNQSVLDNLRKLEKHHFIKRAQAAARSIVILPLGYKLLGKPPQAAFLGAVSAGLPMEAIELTGNWQKVSPEVAKLKDDVFLLKISGDSMLNAGIDDEDIVLVKAEKEFVSGDIVLAQINGQSTVKRFVSDDKPPFIYLKPENPKYNVIPADEDMRLTGKVISVFKNGYWKPVK